MLKAEDGRSTYIDLATQDVTDLENPKSNTANKIDEAIRFVCNQPTTSKTSITALMRKLLQREKAQCKESDSKHCLTVKATQAPAGSRG
ncbi:hypothetical protein A3758_35870 [Oleiphilus sp. HI0118]|nr:hypothetical protein A3758_35870 [Oleiphilus sp. HI0118]